jgi:hypothetical protein
MAVNVEVWLDEDAQVIVQRVAGRLTLPEFDRLVGLSDACAQRLRDGSRILILVDGTRMDKTDVKVRKASLEMIDRQNVTKMAIFGGNRISRIVSTFLSLAAGRQRVRVFGTEVEARAWLQR